MNFRSLGLAFCFGSLVAAVSACGIGAKSNALQTTDFSAEGSAARKMERLKELKDSILAFSKVATDRANEDELTIPASRLYMASLIQDLKKIAPAASFAEKQKLSIGAWQEVWSDARNPNPPGQKILRPNVFQVLFEDGKGFNFGVRSITLPTGAEVARCISCT